MATSDVRVHLVLPSALAASPSLRLTAGLAIAGVTLMRHFAQTEADRQRRITESFSKATEQLGSDKLELRLGGIYTLERISKRRRRHSRPGGLCAAVRSGLNRFHHLEAVVPRRIGLRTAGNSNSDDQRAVTR
jgi:hypothetical protein